MKTIILILVLFYSTYIYPQFTKDTIYAIVTKDSITIRHYNLTRTCGSSYFLSAYRTGNEITIFETDTSKIHERCYCLYNNYITIAPLPADTYNVYVKMTSLYFGSTDTVLAGTTSFIVKSKSNSDSIRVISQEGHCVGKPTFAVQEFKNGTFNLTNYPNPLENKTTISFQLEKASAVSLKLFDYSGKEVASLINTNMIRGKHEIEYDNHNLNPGFYFLQLKTPEKTETIKVSVIRN